MVQHDGIYLKGMGQGRRISQRDCLLQVAMVCWVERGYLSGIRRVSGEARAPRKHWKLELGLDYPVKRGPAGETVLGHAFIQREEAADAGDVS